MKHPKPSERLLRELYLEQMMSYRQLMVLFKNKSARAIKRWLLSYGIPIRYGSDAVKTQWIDADQRRINTAKKAKESFEPYWGMEKTPEVREKIRQGKLGKKNPMHGKSGAKHHLFLGGKKTWAKGRTIPKEKKDELKRILGGKCQECGDKSKVEIHHEPPYRICKSHDLKFLRLLCPPCHREADRVLRLKYPRELTSKHQPTRRLKEKDAQA